MTSFKNDYGDGAHPRVLEALSKNNHIRSEGYGEDIFCQQATTILQGLVGRSCPIYFLSGGTQVNLILIAHALRPYESVISPDTGHIATHEAGAIESTGHKVITAITDDGKLTPKMILEAIRDNDMPPHMAHIRMVYLSQPTEIGTLYSRDELYRIRALCREKDLYLYIDGARLASALAAQQDTLGLSEYAKISDAFYIGGTKCGALFGEALVIPNEQLAEGFRYSMKQRGAMLAKGRSLGIQFTELFRDGLYREIGAHANTMALYMRDELQKFGVHFLIQTETNQQFPIFPDPVAQRLGQGYGVMAWSKYGNESTVTRCVTSWATQKHDVHEFILVCKKLLENTH